ncbi:hypothetical protein [Methylobacterium iners]|uniref:Uncharacterized protein n=1 Tax=Methylobacterium iners TaxID=418707 RepID=A0ABQ4S250_9HYPH|nr:hypothetical protein [Methylobacterium iners]GJD96257.1 hypothetical protein OCOJLMKI_3477 [Methylobacterium iners]
MYKVACVGLVFTCVGFAAIAQSAAGLALDKLGALPKPKGQTDLDTTRIVSVERAMVASTEERTSGLWQSWRVAVCQGCGIADQRTVAEINLATAAYARPGDTELLSRPRAPQSSEVR